MFVLENPVAAQGADDLVERRPGNSGRDEMNLEGVNVLEPESVRRAAEMAAEFRDGVDVGSLRLGERLRTVISSIMRRHRGVISAIWGSLS